MSPTYVAQKKPNYVLIGIVALIGLVIVGVIAYAVVDKLNEGDMIAAATASQGGTNANNEAYMALQLVDALADQNGSTTKEDSGSSENKLLAGIMELLGGDSGEYIPNDGEAPAAGNTNKIFVEVDTTGELTEIEVPSGVSLRQDGGGSDWVIPGFVYLKAAGVGETGTDIKTEQEGIVQYIPHSKTVFIVRRIFLNDHTVVGLNGATAFVEWRFHYAQLPPQLANSTKYFVLPGVNERFNSLSEVGAYVDANLTHSTQGSVKAEMGIDIPELTFNICPTVLSDMSGASFDPLEEPNAFANFVSGMKVAIPFVEAPSELDAVNQSLQNFQAEITAPVYLQEALEHSKDNLDPTRPNYIGDESLYQAFINSIKALGYDHVTVGKVNVIPTWTNCITGYSYQGGQ